ncbi:hypothetical protein [Streptomyces albipurpureus]|uniref:Integral membrane protein n=1 Tax=Streptomyces albipurpureus TaxID=2897419 RepID=A0ABT0V0B3_9ACTN|nr:hypothetical protein [Streptomyces sp. CWNU-1]MCM2394272.1 hypothetical protein [Streptomyces sp. CWNU-1]
MSSDQQYPYPPQPGQQGQPYDPYADSYQGQAQPGQQDGQQTPYGDQAHQPQPQPYQQPGPYTPQQPAPQPFQQQQQQQQQQSPYGQPYAQAAPGHQDPSAQTWEGETWDTTYQPAVPPHTAPAAPSPAAAETAYMPPVRDHQPGPAPAETAYLPPVRDTRQATPHGPGSPLPPEARPTAPRPPGGHAAPAPAAAQGSPGEGYSTPTTAGNTRITDAQRARAEGRSPIIAPGIQPAALTAGLGLLLAVGAALGSYAMLLPLVLLQAVTAAGWFRLNGMWPARQGIALAFAGGLAADGVLLWAGRENAPAAILGTLGVWVLLTLVLQLRSHAGADERMYGLMATVASAALAILAAGYFAASDDAVTVGAIAVAVATVVRALPLPGPASIVVSLLAAAGAGAVVGGMTDLGSGGALLGVVAGVMALVGLRVASYDYPSRFVHFTAGVALPLTAAAPAVYLIGRVLA